jgi:diaminohydroxyphosphoribosylaminopyrimidine deaminase/5-amino-6-(5-phosphoribosylamino)uracil reductase
MTGMEKENRFMLQALNEAWKYQFLTYPNPAVGACVVQNDVILSVEAHHEAGMPHAEVNALKSAYLKKYPNSQLKELISAYDIHHYLINNHNGFFETCEIYVTLEPCNHTGKTPACANILKEVGIKKVYIGMLDPNDVAMGGKDTLKNAGIDTQVGVMEKECVDLLYPFEKWQKGKFKFFKLAIREDGSCDGGYITSQDSLNLVHEIRTKLDLLIIGGETVRVDRPTLDTRFAKHNNPSDILILSRKKEFDQSIPLFSIKNREVIIDDDISKYPHIFSMIEGGYNFLKLLKNDIDILMLFISHKEKLNDKITIEELGFEYIYSYNINEVDEIIFYKSV